MADLNALIAQGAQFNMPDQLGQYAKMQQLQSGQQQMRTAALQEQTAGMQLQQLKQDRDNMAKLSQQLSVKGINPRQYFEALQTSGDPKHQQLGIEGLMKLDATEAFDRSQQTIPGQTPARVGGELGSGTAFMDNALPGMPAPVNALATRAAAPAVSTNALAPTPAAADPAVTAIEAEMRRIQPFVSSGATGAKEAMARLEKKLEIASKRYTVGDTLMGQMGNVFGTAPAKAAAQKLHVVNGNLVRDDGTVVFTAPKTAGDGAGVPKAPSGYRVTATGDLEAIPGGPAAGKPMTDLQKQAYKKDFANDTANIKSASDTANELEKLTDELVGNPDKGIKAHPGLRGITGYSGLVPSLPTGDAAKAEQKLETFKGKIKALGRTIASQQGKLGNMAVQEWQMVSDAVQSIKPTAGNLDVQMRDVVRQAQQLSKNMQDKFDLTYEGDLPAAGKPAPAASGGGEWKVVK